MAPSPQASSPEKNPWIAALASAFVPGLGQLYGGHRQRAFRLLAIDGGLLAVVLVGVLFFQLELIKLWAALPSLGWVMVVNILLLSYRAWAADDAFRLVANKESRALGTSMAAFAVTALVVLGPHAVLGYYDLVQYSIIDEVFADSEGAVTATASETTLPGTGDEVAAEGLSPTTLAPAADDPAIWDGLERLNILLLGGDSGAGRTGVRTDTTILVSIDPETGDAAMFSVPRDFSGIELPDGLGIWDCNCFPDLVNDLYIVAEENPEAFPGPSNPGVNAMKGAVGKLFGLDIHYYALVTLDGFIGIVDALGGVTIDAPFTIIDETYPHEDGVTIEHVEIPAGENHLDGHLALAYARIRRHANDFARMNRQRCLIEAVLEQSSPVELAINYPAIGEVMKESLVTDIPQDRLVDFIDLLPKVSTERIASLRITREVYQSGSDVGRVYYDQDQIRSDAQAMLADPESAYAQLGLESLDETCS
jgi:LCP family protein required for cell wall assembly